MSVAPPPSFSAALDHVGEALELVERAMREQLATEAEVIAAVGDHVLSSGGKRVRPAILLLAAELCGYTGTRRVQVAAAVELLHTATLLHDDVVDSSPLRRGRPSAMALWGNRRAVLDDHRRRAAIEEVAREHRAPIAPERHRRRAAAPQRRRVHDVVVQQRRGV